MQNSRHKYCIVIPRQGIPLLLLFSKVASYSLVNLKRLNKQVDFFLVSFSYLFSYL